MIASCVIAGYGSRAGPRAGRWKTAEQPEEAELIVGPVRNQSEIQQAGVREILQVFISGGA